MNEQKQQQRLTAYKVRISHLVNAEFTKPGGEWVPSYIYIKDKKVSRVNIIATVISKYVADDNQYISLTIDDGSDSIQTKSWKEDAKVLNNIEIGDLILVIAKVKNYNDQNYLSPEIVKPLNDMMWVELRKKELNNIYGPVLETNLPNNKNVNTSQGESEETFTQAQREKVLGLVESLSSEDGADINEIISKSEMSESSANKLIQELLKEGEIFEIKPGALKIIS